MLRTSKAALVVIVLALMVLPWQAHGDIVIGPGEADGISPVLPVDNEGRQRETFILQNPANPLNLIMGWNERSAGRNSGQGFVSSFDYGANWGTSGEIFDNLLGHSDPALCGSATGGPLGTVVFTYIHNTLTGVYSRQSFDGGVTFPGPTIPVQLDTLGAAIDKNWAVTDLEPTSPFFDWMYMVVTDRDGTAASPLEMHVLLSASSDQGATWPVTSVQLDVDGDGLIVQGPTIDTASIGVTIHTWWEGTGATPLPFNLVASSNTGGGGGGLLPPVSVNATGSPAIPALTPVPGTDFYGSMNNGLAGSTFRVNSFPYVAVDNNPSSPFVNNVYIVSTNAAAAALGAGTDPDVLLWRYPGGSLPGVLSGPAVRNGIPILNDDATTQDQIFPSITVAPDGTVEVFWLDTRNDPGGSPRPRFDIYYTASTDGGVTWSPNRRITPATFDHSGNTFIGDYDWSCTNRGGAPGGGGHTWRSYVVQNASGSGTDPTVQAVNNTGPTAALTGPTAIDCSAAGSVTYDASGTTDIDADPLTYDWLVTAVPPAPGFPLSVNTGTTPSLNVSLPFVPPGVTYTVQMTATDFFGATGLAQVVTTVSDSTPPTVTCSLGRRILFPVRGAMVPPLLSYTVTDNCDPSPTASIAFYSDELDLGPPFTPDAGVNAAMPGAVWVRSDRDIRGNGRVYLLMVGGTDWANLSAYACCTVVVPKLPTAASIMAVLAEAAVAEAGCNLATGAPPGGYTPLLPTTPLP